MKRILAASVLGVIGIAGSAMGGGIDKAWVDQEAGWIAHIDVEGLMQTRLGSVLMDQIDADGGRFTLEEMLAMMQGGADDDALGLAIMREVRDVTVVGRDDEEPDLMVARTSPVVHAMMEAMKHEGAFQMIEKGGHSIVALDEDGDDGYAVVLPTADKDTYRVVLSDTVDKLVGAVAASHTRRGGPAWVDGAEGKLVFLHVADPAAMAGDDLPPFLQDAGEVEFSLAEKDGVLDASLLIETGDEAAATDMVAAFNGFVALGRMIGGSDPELAQLVQLTNGLAVQSKGGALMANLTMDVDALLETIGPMIDIGEDEVSVHIDVDVDVDDDDENELE